MTLLIAHFSVLAWFSYATASHLAREITARLLATAILFWTNIVVICLLLSSLGKLGEKAWFFRTSLLLGLVVFGLVKRYVMRDPTPAPGNVSKEKPHRLLQVLVYGSLSLILLANLRIAWVYEPNNYDSLTYHLSRVMYYLGQNSLAHFQTEDIRQVFFTFNYNLLQLACFIYHPPLQSINFLNVAAWIMTGVGLYRVTRFCGCSANASLAGTWLALTATGVLAQATATTLDLPTVGALLASFVFALRWRENQRPVDAMLAGLAAGLAAGAKLTVVFFGPAVVLLILLFWLHHWKQGQNRAFFSGVRAWLLPAALAIALSIPFILYNLSATGHWMTDKLDFTLNKPFSFAAALQTTKGYLFQLFFEPFGRFTFDMELIRKLNDWFAHTFFSNWNTGYAYSDFYVIPPDLNEDHVWYGFAAPLFLICALICLWRDRRLHTPLAWFALLALGWFVTYFAMNKWSLYIQRYFLPAIVLMAPCAAAVWDGVRGRSQRPGPFKKAVFYAVALTSAWFAVVYLTQNHSRAFYFPFSNFTPPQVVPTVPALLKERLGEQDRINIITEGTNERVFLLMNAERPQRFTSSKQPKPDCYNVFSCWGFTRNNIYSNIAHIASHTMVHIPTKRTAGVEFLGTIGEGVNAFDYYGSVPHAAETPPTTENRNLAVIVHYAPKEPDRFADCRLSVNGLNVADKARVEISAELTDGTFMQLMNQTDSGQVRFSLRQPFKGLRIQVFDLATGRRIGFGDLPYTTRPTEADNLPPVGADTLFQNELISSAKARNLVVNGLAGLEGPYAQWNLPLFRWAKQPVVRIEVPQNPKLKQIKLSFKARLQMRDQGRLSVLHNGVRIRDYLLNNSSEWLEQVIMITPAPGDNVIELADQPYDKVPDWLGYLDENPDVKAAVLASNEPPEVGARTHYTSHGKAEGRVLPMRPRVIDEIPDWDAYLNENADVKAYAATSGQTPEEAARWHYENHGKAENRILPMRVNPTPTTPPPPPDSLYYIYRSLLIEGFSSP